MKALLVQSFTILMLSFIGGYLIGDGVKQFKQERWFVFGVDVMLTIYEVLLIITVMF